MDGYRDRRAALDRGRPDFGGTGVPPGPGPAVHATVGFCALLAGAAACGPMPPPESPTPPAEPPASTWVEAGPSFLPNLGVEVGLGRTLGGGSEFRRSLELHAAWQFLDDEDFADDGHPKAGPWYQVRAGVRWRFPSRTPRHLVTRLGGVWIRAEGRPNIVQEGGDYMGVYGGVGFESDLSPTLSVGPELTILGITRTNGLSFARPVPQVNWHVTLRRGSADGSGSPPSPSRGEVYGGASGVVSPGVGAGLVLGQVFRRGAAATWSVEVTAGLQPPRGRLFFEEDGRWAQVQLGVKSRLRPEARGHWAFRGGAVWLRSTAANPFLDVEADHIGAYAGLGYELDLGESLATGPDLGFMLVSYESDAAFRLVPQLRWHLLVRP